MQVGSVVGDLAVNHWDLGSIPRSTQNSMLFCLMCSRAGYQKHSTICPQRSACQVATNSNPMAKDGWTPCSWSMQRADNFQSQQAWKLNGLEFLNKPSNLAQTPPWVCISFFILFSLFHLLYLFLLFF